MAIVSTEIAAQDYSVAVPTDEEVEAGVRRFKLVVTSAGDLICHWSWIDPAVAQQLGEHLVETAKEFREKHGDPSKLIIVRPDAVEGAAKAIDGIEKLRTPDQG